MVRHFLEIVDLSREEAYHLLHRAAKMKADHVTGSERLVLARHTLGMIFEKASTRTRVSFEVGMAQLGGHAVFLPSRDTQMGRGEPIRDTARVLSRYCDILVLRTYAHETLLEMARYATVPVINGLTDTTHPCQVAADLFTVYERFSRVEGLVYAWVGDGNNMANSWINAAGVFGLTLRIACPVGYEPDGRYLEAARARGATIDVVRDARAAVEGAHVVSTDVFVSMGQEGEAEKRLADFAGFQINEALMAHAHRDAVFLHCLPAHRGEEVSEGVFEGPQSAVWEQAENRLHVQKAIICDLLGV